MRTYDSVMTPSDDGHWVLKSEADEVIEELKDKCRMHDFFWDGCGFAKRGFKNAIAVSEAYDFLEAENTQLKESIAVYQRNEKIDIRELRHQKYKRCLAMAERCKDKIENAVQYDEHDDWLIINEYWERWHERWLKMAKLFKDKEAK